MEKYIYKITNLKNNKVYIGQTKNYNRRISSHKSMLKSNNHTNKNLQEDYNKYGLESFEFSYIQIVNENIALDIETYWINYYGGIESENTYNMTDIFTSNYQVKIFISNSNKGNIKTQRMKNIESKFKTKFYQTNKGIKVKDQISKTLKDYFNTEKGIKQRNQLSNLAKKRIANKNGMYGKYHSDSTKKLISQKNKGRIAWNKGKKGLYKTKESTKQKQRIASIKYTKAFIDQLKDEYSLLKTYKKVAKKYSMNPLCVSRLIRFGTTQCYKNKV